MELSKLLEGIAMVPYRSLGTAASTTAMAALVGEGVKMMLAIWRADNSKKGGGAGGQRELANFPPENVLKEILEGN